MKKMKYVCLILLCFFLFSCDKKQTGIEAQNDFTKEVKTFEQSKSDSFVVNMELRLDSLDDDDINLKLELKTILPSYLEIWDNDSNQRKVYQSESGNLFLYEILDAEDSNLHATKTFSGVNDGFSGFQFAKMVSNCYQLPISSKNIEINQKNKTFTFAGKLEDFLSLEEKELLDEIFSEVEELEQIYASSCEIRIKFEKKNVAVSYHIDFKTNKIKNSVALDLKFELTYGAFEKMNLKDYTIDNELPEQKESVVQELSSKMNEFYDDRTKNYIVYTDMFVNIKNADGLSISRNSISEEIKISTDTIYYEKKNSETDEVVIVQEEQKKLFQYRFDDSRNEKQEVKRTYLGYFDPAFSSLHELNILNSNVLFLYPLETDTLKSASKTSDGYQLDCIIKDMMSEEEIDEIFAGLGVYEKEILKSYFTTNVTINDTMIQQHFKTAFLVSIQGDAYPLELDVVVTIQKYDFEKVNLNDTSKYYIEGPKSIDEVTVLTSLDTDIELDYQNSYYGFELTEGYYAITAPTEHDLYNLHYGLALYNSNQEQVQMGIGIDYKDYYYMHQVVFHVEKAGTYYLCMGGGGSSFTCKVIRLPYQNCHYKNNPLDVSEPYGTIDGRFDFKCYKYTALEEGILKIENKKDTLLSMLIHTQVSYKPYECVTIKDYIYIHVSKGDNYFYICSNSEEEGYAYSYEFNISLLDVLNDASLDYDALPSLTEHYSEQAYFAGLGYSNKAKFSFEVVEAGKYKFEANFIEKSQYANFDFIVKDLEGKTIYVYDGFEFTPGKYIVELDLDPRFYAIGFVRYVKAE